MRNDPTMNQLARLLNEANRSIISFSQQTRLIAKSSDTRHGAKRNTLEQNKQNIGVSLRLSGRANPRAGSNFPGLSVLLKDERQMRVLAKEIKRLIVEDKRRGLAV